MQNVASRLLALIASLVVAFAPVPARAQLFQIDEADKLSDINPKKGAPGATPCMVWMDPVGPKKGVLVAVHGLGLHKGCYRQFAERMVSLGWAVYAVDVRGFGTFMTMPQGARHVDFAGAMEDVCGAIRLVRQEHPGMPVFLVGESMGGGLAIQCGAKYGDLVDGIVTACPASKRHHTLSATARVAANLLAGHKSMDVRPILVEHSTKNLALRNEWLHDPEARFELAPTELIHFQTFMDSNEKAARVLKKPICILQGTADDLVKAEAQETLLKCVPHDDKQLVYVDQAEHLLLEEGQFNDRIISAISGWLDLHMSGGLSGRAASAESSTTADKILTGKDTTQ